MQPPLPSCSESSVMPEDVDLDLDMTRAAGVGTWTRATAGSPLTADSIVVVSGLPRSGTSMMMQMLRAGGMPVLTDDVRPPDTSNPRGYFEYEPTTHGSRDTSWVAEARGRAVKLVAQLLPSVLRHSDIRVIFMERALGSIVASQSAMLQRLDRDGARLSDRRLAATYQQQLARLRLAIERASDGVSVFPVSYDAALQDPATAASAVNRFLGGRLDESAMAASIAPQLRTIAPVAGTDRLSPHRAPRY